MRREELSQQQKLQHQLIFSPQMQKSLALLQLPVMELEMIVSEELQENPILEYSEEEERIAGNDLLHSLEEKTFGKRKGAIDDLQSVLEATVASEDSLFDLLMRQAREHLTPEQVTIAEVIFGNLDEKGFLGTPLEEISALEGIALETLQNVLEQIQLFDPPGVGAKDVQESLLIQLRRQGKEKTLAYKIVEGFFDEMKSNRLPQLAKKSGLSLDRIREVIAEEIALLDLHPARGYSQSHTPEPVKVVVPDVIVQGEEVVVNEKSIPPFRINPHYLQMLASESLPHETREYIEEKIESGKWLMRNLCERGKTLHRIATALLQKQTGFFAHPTGNLISLTMKEIAEELSLHESTIARAVAGKYLSCERGTFPLRSFFTHAYTTEQGDSLGAPAVKELVQKLITEENPQNPYSDEQLSALLKERGIPCARRTIAKYRTELNLGSRSQRKRY